MPRKSGTTKIERTIAKLPTGFAEDMGGADEAQLRQEILKAVDAIAETKAERDADDKLNGAKELVKELSGAYTDALTAQNAKIDYCKHLLAERGKEAAGA